MGGTSSAKAGKINKRAKKTAWVSMERLFKDIDRGCRYFWSRRPTQAQHGLRDF